MEAAEKLLIRQLHKEVEAETDEARHRFDYLKLNIETPGVPLAFAEIVLIEEVGKLVRCHNKLRVVQDAEIIKQWRSEQHHRFVTTGSVLERLYLESCKRDR